LEIKDLSFSYRHRQIFERLNILFSDEKVNVIIGPNGVGKTTLLDIIAGLHQKQVHMNLIDVPNHRSIAYQLQQIRFFPTLTVAQTIQMYQKIDHNGGSFPTSTMSKIKSVVLDAIQTEKLGNLSGGEKQIVLNYGTCLLNRELYIFDEPTSGVDLNNSQSILKMIASLSKEQHKKVIITSHQINQLEYIPAHFIVLNNKGCVFTGSYEELLIKEDEEDADKAIQNLIAI